MITPEGTVRIFAVLLCFISFSVHAQSRDILDCAGYTQQIDTEIMNAEYYLHDQEVGVRKENTMTFEEVANIRQKIWQATLQERFDIRHITHLGNVPNCARIAESAINKVRAILDSNLSNAQISRRE
jgi:hypothetical protein